jgi:formamidopyrimidine-DNA glycosylase
MPELAEVEFFRRQWDPGLGSRILAVDLHPQKRLFRQIDCRQLQRRLTGATFLGSETRGKQMVFRFSGGAWLGLHLGMSGRLRMDASGFVPGAHDHLVLRQQQRTLVFTDPRVFGRVRFHQGKTEPPWWANLPPELQSSAFTLKVMSSFLQRHPRAPIKAVLLLQTGFPGVGNWMADEILWRARLDPRLPAGQIDGAALPKLCRAVKFVCRGALRTVARDFSDPPKDWLFHQRWEASGQCPIHTTPLSRVRIGGRTSAWCPRCQT